MFEVQTAVKPIKTNCLATPPGRDKKVPWFSIEISLTILSTTDCRSDCRNTPCTHIRNKANAGYVSPLMYLKLWEHLNQRANVPVKHITVDAGFN